MLENLLKGLIVVCSVFTVSRAWQGRRRQICGGWMD